MKIMLVDDEHAMRTLVERILLDNGYDFVSTDDGLYAIEVFEREKPDLLLLDIMLPGMDGFEICEKLRSQGETLPIIFLSAKGDTVDRRVGFSSGANDFIVKPFSAYELILKVQASLRDHRSKESTLQEHFKTGSIEIDLTKHEVFVKGERVELTPKEYLILMLLATHPGEVFTKEQLIEEVWGKEFVGETTSLAVFIRKIREKIEEDPADPKLLQTVWHVGYRFAELTSS